MRDLIFYDIENLQERFLQVHTLPLHPQQQVTTVNVLICSYKGGQKQQIITTL
jgi:hypothetical protein